jgi:hypothetical protein
MEYSLEGVWAAAEIIFSSMYREDREMENREEEEENKREPRER